ncbi:fertilization-influencing membrane protein isoform X2 [Hemicordylus capensis]|uniref:fertilization-influencing membrane protein isoform X2 n=1 Tax=Hemicordylus capensis TaxID=884348 RepID=UPI002302328D|nr:fertilization-influencing membrane protein isoform X2 [Hemicordylus capensis]
MLSHREFLLLQLLCTLTNLTEVLLTDPQLLTATFPGLLRYILVGSVVLLVLFSLYQIISKVIFKASSPPATATEEKSGATP